MSELEQEFFRILTRYPKYFELDNVVTTLLRRIGWGIIKFLIWIADSLQKASMEIFDLVEFLRGAEMQRLTQLFVPATYAIGTLSLVFYAIKKIIHPDLKMRTFVDSLLLGIATVSLSSLLITQLLSFGTTISKELYSDGNGANFVYEMVNKTGTDTLTAMLNNFEESKSHIHLSPDNIAFFDYGTVLTEKIMKDDALVSSLPLENTYGKDFFKIFNYSTQLAPATGDVELVETSTWAWLGLPQAYYRYHLSLSVLIVYLMTIILVYLMSLFKYVKLFFEIFFANVLLPLFAFSDLNGAKGVKTILNSIKNAGLTMVLCSLTLKVYTLFQVWVGQQEFGIVAIIIIQLGLAIAVIDGANVAQELTGYDAGLRSVAMTAAGIGVGATTGLKGVVGGAKLTWRGGKWLVQKGGAGLGKLVGFATKNHSTEAKDQFVQDKMKKDQQSSNPSVTKPTTGNPQSTQSPFNRTDPRLSGHNQPQASMGQLTPQVSGQSSIPHSSLNITDHGLPGNHQKQAPMEQPTEQVSGKPPIPQSPLKITDHGLPGHNQTEEKIPPQNHKQKP